LRWFQRDQLHREHDLPALVDPDGSQWWFIRGVRHRDNGRPAVVIPNHVMEWYEQGKLHCETGPARVSAEGAEEYWLRGVQVDELRITELIEAKRGY
jgi:hypothetical protein